MTTPTQTQTSPRIRRISATRYLVESRSQPGVGHQVDVQEMRCSCPAGRNNQRCFHLVYSLGVEAYDRRARSKSARHAAA